MRKLITILCILSGTICSAQNIDTTKLCNDWNKLVDYVNCHYVATYIESQGNTPDYEKYIKNIKPFLVNRTIDNPLNFDTLSMLLKKNNWGKTEEKVAALINERKTSENRTLDRLLDINNFDPKIQIAIEATKDSLQENIGKCYLLQNKKESIKQEEKQSTSTKENMENNGSMIVCWLLLFVIIILIVLFVYWMKKILPRQIKKIAKGVVKEQESAQVFNKDCLNVNELKAEINGLKKQITNLQKSINNIPQQNQPVQNPKTQEIVENPVPKSESKIIFVKYFGDNSFSECEQNNAHYKLIVDSSNAQRAKFSFCGNMRNAIAQKDAILKDVCELQGYTSSAETFEIISDGEAVLENGKWKVENKSVIKFK